MSIQNIKVHLITLPLFEHKALAAKRLLILQKRVLEIIDFKS